MPIFTLPGNPVSAYVSFQIFVRPAIGALQAYDGLGLETVRAELTGPLRSPPGRRSFMRGVLDRPAGRVAPLTGQGSHQVATLGKANALIIVPEWSVRMAAGETADVLVLPLVSKGRGTATTSLRAKGRGADWTDERGRSEEGRRRVKSARRRAETQSEREDGGPERRR